MHVYTIQVPDPCPGSWIQDPGSRNLAPLDPGSRVWDPGSWSRLLYPGSRILGLGCRIEGPAGSKVLDRWPRIQDAGSTIQGPVFSRTQYRSLVGMWLQECPFIRQIALAIGVLTVLVKGPWKVPQSVSGCREHFLLQFTLLGQPTPENPNKSTI